jgi:3-oxoacyl-[acyl-carrier protein] reductase
VPVALVTGASRGIGAACAKALARDGFDVGLTYAADSAACAQTAQAVAQLGRRAHAVHAEMRDPASVAAGVAAIEHELGPLDALVVNAGTTRDALALRMDAQTWQAPIAVNLTGAFHTIQAAAAGMLTRRHGSIVVLTSIVGVHGNAGQANYASSKAGLIGLTRTLAREFGSAGVRVNALAPGYVATRLTDALSEDQRDQMLAATSLARLGTPDDIAGPVAFLCSPASRFITGTVLPVDGGLAL